MGDATQTLVWWRQHHRSNLANKNWDLDPRVVLDLVLVESTASLRVVGIEILLGTLFSFSSSEYKCLAQHHLTFTQTADDRNVDIGH